MRRKALIGFIISLVTFAFAAIAFWIDPWTGEGDANEIGIKIVTVPLPLLAFPFAFGMLGTSMNTGINRGWIPILVGRISFRLTPTDALKLNHSQSA